MPINFAQLGAKAEDIPYLVDILCNGNGRKGFINGFVTINEQDAEKIYNLML